MKNNSAISFSITRVLLFSVILIFVYLFYFAKIKTMVIFYGGISCVADYINTLYTSSWLRSIIIPLSTFFVILELENNLSPAYLTRHKNRKSLILKNHYNMIFIAVITIIPIILISFLVAFLFTPIVINWDNSQSYHYVSTGQIFEDSLLSVIFSAIIPYLSNIIFYSCIGLNLMQVVKKNFSILIVLILGAVDILKWIGYIVFYSQTQNIIFDISLCIVCILVSFYTSILLNKRRDYL